MSQELDRGKRHDISTIDQGLVYLAMAYGKSRKASRMMAEDGLTPIPASTLDHWKKVSHVSRYETLRDECERRLNLDAAERMDALVSRALDLEEDILEKTAEKLDGMNVRDLPNAYKNIAVGSGVLQDKSRILRDKPTEIVETRSYANTIRRLMNQGVLEGTAEEIQGLVEQSPLLPLQMARQALEAELAELDTKESPPPDAEVVEGD